MYTDSTCIFKSVESVKNAIGRTEDTTTDVLTTLCYVSEEAGKRNTDGNEAVRYTHLLYTPYHKNVTTDMLVEYNGNVYDITGIWAAPRNHHLEIGLTRRSSK